MRSALLATLHLPSLLSLHRSHLQDLKETTDKVHYETFRHQRLQQSHNQSYLGESNI